MSNLTNIKNETFTVDLIFKSFKKNVFCSLQNENTCPFYHAEEKNKNNEKLFKNYIYKKKGVSFAPLKKLSNPHHPAFYKILALHMVFVTNKNQLFMELFVSN